MSMTEDYEKLKNELGSKKYKSLNDYIKTFGKSSEWHQGLKNIRTIENDQEYEKKYSELHQKCKPIFIEDVWLNPEEWDKFEKWYQDKFNIRKAKFSTKIAADESHNGEIVEIIDFKKGKDIYNDRYTIRFNDGSIKDNIMAIELDFEYKENLKSIIKTENINYYEFDWDVPTEKDKKVYMAINGELNRDSSFNITTYCVGYEWKTEENHTFNKVTENQFMERANDNNIVYFYGKDGSFNSLLNYPTDLQKQIDLLLFKHGYEPHNKIPLKDQIKIFKENKKIEKEMKKIVKER